MKINYEEKSHLFEKKSTKVLTSINIFAGVMLLLTFITMIIWCFYHEAKVVSGQSMQPTINSDYSEENNQFDIVIINKTQNISRGDIVVIDFSSYTKDELIIKRVIALGGDSVKIVWNSEAQKSDVYLKKKNEDNFSLLDEPFTQTTRRLDGNTCAKTFQDHSQTGKYESYTWRGYELNADGSITILDGFFFALGDNRENSLDSSEVGPFLREHVIGVAATIEKNGSFMNNFLKKFFHLTLNKNK